MGAKYQALFDIRCFGWPGNKNAVGGHRFAFSQASVRLMHVVDQISGLYYNAKVLAEHKGGRVIHLILWNPNSSIFCNAKNACNGYEIDILIVVSDAFGIWFYTFAINAGAEG
jgi:hypothetical protein